VLVCPHGELRPRREAQFVKDVPDVPFGGGLGDHQLCRNGSVAQPASYQCCNFALSRRKRAGPNRRRLMSARLGRFEKGQGLGDGLHGRQRLAVCPGDAGLGWPERRSRP
jgi:hypothetical protein